MTTGHPEQIAPVPCPVCGVAGAQRWPVPGDSQQIACTRCGRFEIADSAAVGRGNHPGLRCEASRAINQMPRPATGWLFVTSYMLHELFPMELGSVDG